MLLLNKLKFYIAARFICYIKSVCNNIPKQFLFCDVRVLQFAYFNYYTQGDPKKLTMKVYAVTWFV